MFRNVGKEIKILANGRIIAQLITGIAIAALVIIAGILISSIFKDYTIGIILLSFLIAILIIVMVYQSAKLSVIKLYAFGQLVENSDKIVKHLGIKDDILPQEIQPKKALVDLIEQKKDRTPLNAFSEKGVPVVSITTNHDSWICPDCCRKLPNNTKVCKCGYTK